MEDGVNNLEASGDGQDAIGEGESDATPTEEPRSFGLAAIRSKQENTKAYRELQVELAGRRCEHCGQFGPYRVVSSPKKKEGEKKIRRIQCFTCGHQCKLVSDN